MRHLFLPRFSRQTLAACCALALLYGLPGSRPAQAQEPAPAAPHSRIQYNGLIDGYFQLQAENAAGTVITGRVFDVRVKTPTLALAELNVFENARPGGFGFKTTLTAGDTADIVHGSTITPSGNTISNTGEAQFKNIQQLYGTYAFAGPGGGIDIGKFVTPFGYEVIESNADYNYSRSLPFAIIPFYNAGARLYTPSMRGLVATAYLVNAIFNTPTAGVHSDNGRRKFIGQLSYADPKGKFTLIATLGLGKDRLGGTDTQVVLNDDDFTYNFDANRLVGLDYVYSDLKPDDGAKSKTNGYAVYYRQQFTPRTAYALRFSGFDQKTDGVSPDTQPYEITATYELKPAANFLTRLEYRHDHSNSSSAFLDKNADLTKSSQDTLTLAGVFTF